MANITIRLRDVAGNLLAGTTISNQAGEFSFTGLQPGTYAVEAVNEAGDVIGTSSATSLAADATITGVTVTIGDKVGCAAAGGLSKGAIVGIVVASAAIATIIIVKKNGSPSN